MSPPLRSRAARCRGFTLVEMLAAVVIVGIIAFIATSGARGLRTGGDERAARGVLESALALAQAEAARYPNQPVYLSANGTGIGVSRNGAEIMELRRALPPGFTLPAVSLQVQSDGTTLGPLTFTMTGPEATYTFTIDRGGMVR